MFLGDWHNTRANLNIVTLNYSLKALEHLNDNFERVYFIPGNHDLYYRDKRDIQSVEFAKHLPNVEICNDWFSDGNVVIAPWLCGDDHKKLAKMKGDAPEIELVIGDKKVKVAKFISTRGTPKSDFHAVDASGNEVAWLSHKKGSKAKDFGQWGGMSDREMKVVYANMPEAKEEILKFAKDVIDRYPDGAIPRATTLARKISNGKLRGISIYGNGFGGERGIQNVDLVLQGDPVFKGNKLVATGSAHTNGERIEGEFEPVLMAMYKGDRDNFGVKGARFSIYPAGGRKISEWI